LRREFPSHPLWVDPIFQRADYQRFAREMDLTLAQDAPVRRALPVLVDRMTAFEQSIHQKTEASTQKKDWSLAKLSMVIGSGGGGGLIVYIVS
jgi:hypothetical protein